MTQARALKVGDVVTVYGTLCRVFKVHPFGTVDVEQIEGDRAYRVSGLALAPKGHA